MYIIYGKNYDGTEYPLHDPRTTEFKLTECTSDTERNKTGEMSFTISPKHPYYESIVEKSTEIIVEQDGEFLHSFRVLTCPCDIYKNKTVTCEGELGYLNDSCQRYGEYHDISVADFFKMIIDKHNADVDDKKQFTVGTVNVTDPNDSLYRYAAYENTWDYINDKLINRLGGYINIRHADGKRYIDYVTNYGSISTQTIQLGKNIIDISKTTDATDAITVLIPLGCKIKDADGNETERRLTIEGAVVNDNYYGKDYIEDTDAIKVRGRIVGTYINNDITTADYLYKAGLKYLSEQRLINSTVELEAVDLHLVDAQIEKFRLGDSVRVVSKPHDIDRYMQIEKLHIDYNDPAGFKMTLGYTTATLTDTLNKQISNTVDLVKQTATQIKEETVNIKQQISVFQSTMEQKIDEISSTVSEQTDIKSTLENIRQDFKTSITQNSREIAMNFSSQIRSVRDDVYENTGLIESYIRFRDALIEIGRVGNAFSTQLSNEELAFYEYSQKIAYISGTKLHIVQAEAEKIFTLGNDATGKYDFIAKANGNLTFKWRNV